MANEQLLVIFVIVIAGADTGLWLVDSLAGSTKRIYLH